MPKFFSFVVLFCFLLMILPSNSSEMQIECKTLGLYSDSRQDFQKKSAIYRALDQNDDLQEKATQSRIQELFCVIEENRETFKKSLEILKNMTNGALNPDLLTHDLIGCVLDFAKNKETVVLPIGDFIDELAIFFNEQYTNEHIIARLIESINSVPGAFSAFLVDFNLQESLGHILKILKSNLLFSIPSNISINLVDLVLKVMSDSNGDLLAIYAYICNFFEIAFLPLLVNKISFLEPRDSLIIEDIEKKTFPFFKNFIEQSIEVFYALFAYEVLLNSDTMRCLNKIFSIMVCLMKKINLVNIDLDENVEECCNTLRTIFPILQTYMNWEIDLECCDISKISKFFEWFFYYFEKKEISCDCIDLAGNILISLDFLSCKDEVYDILAPIFRKYLKVNGEDIEKFSFDIKSSIIKILGYHWLYCAQLRICASNIYNIKKSAVEGLTSNRLFFKHMRGGFEVYSFLAKRTMIFLPSDKRNCLSQFSHAMPIDLRFFNIIQKGFPRRCNIFQTVLKHSECEFDKVGKFGKAVVSCDEYIDDDV
jgi:hypothetical protein